MTLTRTTSARRATGLTMVLALAILVVLLFFSSSGRSSSWFPFMGVVVVLVGMRFHAPRDSMSAKSIRFDSTGVVFVLRTWPSHRISTYSSSNIAKIIVCDGPHHSRLALLLANHSTIDIRRNLLGGTDRAELSKLAEQLDTLSARSSPMSERIDAQVSTPPNPEPDRPHG